MFLLIFLEVHLPETVISFVEPAADANAFAAMFMLGLMFQVDFHKSYFQDVILILICRFGITAGASLFCYYIIPCSQAVSAKY